MSQKNLGRKLYFSQFGGEQPIPPEFTAAMERGETRQKVPLDFQLTDLTPDINRLEARFDPHYENINEKWLIEVWKKVGNITLNEINTDNQGQPVQVTRTLFPTGTLSPVEPSAYQNVAVKDLGNGWSILEVGVEGTYVSGVFTPGFFTRDSYTEELPDVVPEEYRSTVRLETVEHDVAGTAGVPTLDPTTGDLMRSETQITNFVKRVVRRFRNPSSASPLTNKEITTEFGGGLVGITRGLYTAGSQTIAGGFLVLKAKLQGLGAGLETTEVGTFQESSYPVLSSIEVNETDLAQISVTEQVIPAGTGTAGFSGGVLTTLKALDRWRTLKTTKTYPTTDFFQHLQQYDGQTNLDLPPQLLSVTGLADGQGSAGTSYDTGYYSISAPGSGHGHREAMAEGSAAVSMDINFDVLQINGNNTPCLHFIMWAQLPVSEATVRAYLGGFIGYSIGTWPRFTPKVHTFLCASKRMGLRVTAKTAIDRNVTVDYLGAYKGGGESGANGASTSYDFSLNTKVVRTPWAIHPAMSLGSPTSGTQSFSASAITDIGASGMAVNNSVSGSVTAAITPTSIPGTGNQETIPTSGHYLHRLTTEPFHANYVKIFVELVNFAQVA